LFFGSVFFCDDQYSVTGSGERMITMRAKSRVVAEVPGRPARGRLLVVEDEPDISESVRYNLSREGFSVRCAASGEEALKAIRHEVPDLMILDLMLPGMDGLDVCRVCRSEPSTALLPIIMLTARGEEVDVVTGLELGADDYVVKPFSSRVLVARIKVVLRRKDKNSAVNDAEAVHIGELVVDPVRYEAKVDGIPAPLTRIEFRILHLLVRRPGRVFTRSQIVLGVQGDKVVVTDRSVDVHVVALRKKLGVAGRYIQTVRGVGYRMEDV
jgi:two-component system phosphate regulon response regulator PhoB